MTGRQLIILAGAALAVIILAAGIFIYAAEYHHGAPAAPAGFDNAATPAPDAQPAPIADAAQQPLVDFTFGGQGYDFAPLETGGKAFSNRNYVWEQIPTVFSGWQYTRTAGGRAAQITVKAEHDATLYAAASGSTPADLADWEPLPFLSFTYNDRLHTPMVVYRRRLTAGQEIQIPQTGWSGVIILVPGQGAASPDREIAQPGTPAQSGPATIAAAAPSAAPPTAAPANPATIPQLVHRDYNQQDYYRDLLEFNRTQLAQAYLAGGRRDPAWDTAASDALELFAAFNSQNSLIDSVYPVFFPTPRITNQALAAASQKVLDAGCDDPMILYMRALAASNEGDAELARQCLERAHQTLPTTRYSALRRFLLAHRRRQLVGDDTQTRTAWNDEWDSLLAMFQQTPLTPAARRSIGREAFIEIVNMNHADYQSTLQKLAALQGADPWMLNYITAELQVLLAWDARGSGTANTVTPDGLRGFLDHLAKARLAAEAACKDHPELPEPAVTMITVAMAESQPAEIHTWFDRAIAAQSDFMPAYYTAFYALSTRWGGSNDQILALVQQAADSGRYDTAIPWQYIAAARYISVDNVGGDPAILAKPPAAQAAAKILRGYADQWKDTPQAPFFRTCLAALAVQQHDMTAARQTLDQIPGVADSTALGFFGLPPAATINQIYLQSWPNQQHIDQLTQAVAAHDYSAAQKTLAAMQNADSPASHMLSFITASRQAATLLDAYSRQQPVSLTGEAARGFWLADFPYAVDHDALAALTNDGLHLTNRYPIPDRRYLLSFRFSFLNPHSTRDTHAGITWGAPVNQYGWGLVASINPPQFHITSASATAGKPVDVPLNPALPAIVEIAYWDGLPLIKINGKPVSLDDTLPLPQTEIVRDNMLYVEATPGVRITQLTLQHLTAKP